MGKKKVDYKKKYEFQTKVILTGAFLAINMITISIMIGANDINRSLGFIAGLMILMFGFNLIWE